MTSSLEIVSQPMPGVCLLKPFIHRDDRGEFVKTFHGEDLQELGLSFEIREEFYSTSAKNVLRGMHFQLPPVAHQKIVYCINGCILDVIVDLRTDSPTYGQSCAMELSSLNRHLLVVPIGFAHGFLSQRNETCVVYKTDREHAPEFDVGIRWDSFGFDWPAEAAMLRMSERDRHHPTFSDFESTFRA